MKKLLIVLMALTLGGGFATISYAGIDGSAHDFEPAYSTEICNVCHTPHNADTSVADAPLWDHSVTSASFTPYPSGGTMDAAPGQPTGISLLCLSCHDGTIAVDSFGGAVGSTFLTASNTGYIGTDLTDDHPISFTYDGTLANSDGELVTPSSSSTVEGNLPLFSSKLECATCHDVHNNGAGSTLLILSNSGSALCLKCHQK